MPFRSVMKVQASQAAALQTEPMVASFISHEKVTGKS